MKSYGEMLLDWKGNGGPAVLVHEGTEQWENWMRYFHQFQLNWILDLLAGRKTWTVPTAHPMDFDHRFNPEIGAARYAAAKTREFTMPKVKVNRFG